MIRGNPELLKELKVYQPLVEVDDFLISPVHILADQTDLLKEYNLVPNVCTHCDFWWVYDDHFILVECSNRHYIGAIYANYTYGDDDEICERVHIGTEITPLTTETIQTIVRNLAEWFDSNREKLEAHTTEILEWGTSPNWLFITSDDIAQPELA